MFVALWDDADWCGLSIRGRHMWMLLLTQIDLTHCGVIPLREGMWAEVAGMTEREVCEDLGELEAIEWTITDPRTRELFVRSLVRRDKVLRQPKLWIPFSRSVKQIRSPRIRSALVAELIRTRVEGEVNASIRSALDLLISDLERQLDSLSASQPGSHAARHRASLSASHPGSLQGEGEGGPLPLTPNPLPPAAAGTAEGEGDSSRPRRADDLAALVSEIRALRPDWSTRSIERAISDPAVAERPWQLVRAAMVTLARDPETKFPGRLSHDGQWWQHKGGAPAGPPRPRWCGDCDEETRLTHGDTPKRCPACHPLSVADVAS